VTDQSVSARRMRSASLRLGLTRDAMADTNNDKHLAQRKREMLAAAERVFDRHGYAAATLDEVAAEAGVAKGSLYNYFQSKHDLFTQVFADVIAIDEAEIDATLARQATATEKIRSILQFWSQNLEGHKRLGRLVLEIWANAARQSEDGEMASWFNEMYSNWRGKIAAIIAQGKAEGEFDVEDPHTSAALLLAVLDGVHIQTLLGVGLEVNEELVAGLERATFNALRGGRTEVHPRAQE